MKRTPTIERRATPASASSKRDRADPERYAVVSLDLEGRIRSWTDDAERITGYKFSDIEGQPISLLYDEGTRSAAQVEQDLALAGQNGVVWREGALIRASGAPLWAAMVLTAIRGPDNAVVGFSLAVRDISARRDSDDVNRGNERGFHALVDSITDYAILMLDPSGRVQTWNKGAERIKGYKPEEIIGKSFEMFYTPEDRAAGKPARLLAEALKNGRATDESWRLRKDGSRFWGDVLITALFDDDRRHIGFSKVTRDLTERRHAEQAMKTSKRELEQKVAERTVEIAERETRLSLAVEAAYMATWDHDLRTGRMYWLVGCERVFGTPANEMPKTFEEFLGIVHVDDRERFRRFVAESIQRGQEHQVEFRVRRADGNWRWLAKRGRILLDEAGAAVRVIGIGVDVTDRREYESQLLKQAEELWRSNRELEQFAYVSSHDLQEPLRQIANFSQLLETYYRDRLDSKGHHYVNSVSQGVLRMRELINDLMSYSRVGKTGEPPQDVDLNAVARDVQHDMGDVLSRAGGALVASGLPTVRGRRSELHQVLQNLVSNAIKYRRQEPPQVRVDAERKDGEWIIHVSDNGLGIEPMYLGQIFKVFHRLHTRAQYPGSGIGLAICKKIVERHGGRIWVRSTPGVGSTFSFTLPEGGKE